MDGWWPPAGTATWWRAIRSVDDQPTWLDQQTIAYGIQRNDGTDDVRSVPADSTGTGAGTPTVLVPGANSPAPLG